MRLKVNLSAQYDLDLIALKENGYLLSKIMSNALIAYANGEQYIVNILPCIINNIKSTSVNITILDNKAIEIMSQIKAGYKTAFIKAVTRAALSTPLIDCYFNNAFSSGIAPHKKEKPLKSQNLKREVNVAKAEEQNKNQNNINSKSNKEEATHSSIANESTSRDLKSQPISPNDIMAAFDNL